MVSESTSRKLTPEQMQVANALPGPILVTGGPGTGKTIALIGRAATFLNKRISGKAIFFLTTSDRRAADLRREAPVHLGRMCRNVLDEDIQRIQPVPLEEISIAWLRQHGAEVLGIPPDFRVWNPVEAVRIATALTSADARLKGVSDREVRGILRWHWFQCSSLHPDEGSGVPSLWRDVLALYHQIQRRRETFAWDEITPMALESMQRDPGRVEAWRRRSLRHWIVDDFQNITVAGYQMLRMIVGENPSISVAGDASQSVYGWKGADRQIIDRFCLDYPDVRIVRLSTNVRSTSMLADLAVRLTREASVTSVVDPLEDRSTLSVRHQGERPQLLEFMGTPDEMRTFVVDEVCRQHALGVPWAQMAVICRRHAAIDALEPVLQGRSIPFTVMSDDRWQGVREPRLGAALCTIHAAQGGQWSDVWVFDVRDRVIPGRMGLNDNSVLAHGEEQRLFLMASTRATDRIRFVYLRNDGLDSPTRFLGPVMDVLEHKRVSAETFYH